MTEYKWAKDAFKDAEKAYPEECCGLIIKLDEGDIYWKCKNISKAYKEKSFVIELISSFLSEKYSTWLVKTKISLVFVLLT